MTLSCPSQDGEPLGAPDDCFNFEHAIDLLIGLQLMACVLHTDAILVFNMVLYTFQRHKSRHKFCCNLFLIAWNSFQFG